eukprot:scaffold149_cov315-Pinguiococcus_pyrenoidosus.AAC.135
MSSTIDRSRRSGSSSGRLALLGTSPEAKTPSRPSSSPWRRQYFADTDRKACILAIKSKRLRCCSVEESLVCGRVCRQEGFAGLLASAHAVQACECPLRVPDGFPVAVACRKGSPLDQQFDRLLPVRFCVRLASRNTTLRPCRFDRGRSRGFPALRICGRLPRGGCELHLQLVRVRQAERVLPHLVQQPRAIRRQDQRTALRDE